LTSLHNLCVISAGQIDCYTIPADIKILCDFKRNCLKGIIIFFKTPTFAVNASYMWTSGTNYTDQYLKCCLECSVDKTHITCREQEQSWLSWLVRGLSEREVPDLIFSDFNVCFDFPLIRVAIALNTCKTEHWQWQGG